MVELAYHGFQAFALSLVMVFACRLAALRFGYIAKPRDDRWHRKPTALLGGVGIALTVLPLHVAIAGPRALPILVIGSALMFIVGLVDDLIRLKPYTKLVAEIAIASLFVFVGYRLGWSESLTLDTLLTMVWIVGVTNAFNLLDNMDGLSAGVSLIAGGSVLAGIVLGGGSPVEARYLALLMGAIAGFLVYNFHPASIFMGDSGSLFIGLNLALLTLGLPQESHGRSNVLSIIGAPLFLLLVPILDTTLVTVSRILAGRSAAQGGRDHSSHRLVAMGLSERAAVAVLWTLAGLGGLLALAIHGLPEAWMSVPAAVFALAMIIFAVYLAHVRVYDGIDDSLVQTGRVTPFVVNFMYRRRVAEVGLDALLASIAYYAAYRLRFEGGEDFAANFPNFLQSLPLVVGVQAVALYVVGVYRGVWRYFGLMDGVTFGKGVALGTLASVSLIVAAYGFDTYSRGVFVNYGALLMLLLSGSRASFRLMSEFVNRRKQGGPRLIIYGAGDVGASAVRDLLGRRGGYRMLGFIDDDPSMMRARMQGYPVLGNFDSLVSLITNNAVELVVITGLLDVERVEALENLCTEHQVALARLHYDLDELVAAS
jgi:UDP-GlcNAc:undecaprenyl-phosphate GlcNAc-1-phosphate transferase